jgi:putative phage-type endonuclease
MTHTPIYIDLEQNSPQWLDFRKGKIGASDASVILGVSPWMTPFQLWEEKLELSKPRDTSSSMQRGKDMEKEALKSFEDESGLVMFPKVVQHPKYEWMIASLDGIDFDHQYIVEIKCPGKADHETALGGKIPDKYVPQIQHQLAVTGLTRAYYYSYSFNSHACITMDRNDAYIHSLIAKEEAFWECIQNFEPPELIDRDCVLITDPAWEELAKEYRHAAKAVKQYEQELEKVKAKLVAMSKGINARGAGLKLMKCFRKGAVDVDSICEYAALDKENFRKKPTNYWRIT